MKLSVIMVDGGFRENFGAVDSWLDQTLSIGRDYELIWVDYTRRVPQALAQRPGVRCLALGRDEPMQVLARAYNEGIVQARGEILVIPDADVVCERDLLESIGRDLEADPEQVQYILRLDQPEELFRAGQDADYLRRTCSISHTYNFGGCTAVGRQWMLKMNGYEQLPIFSGYQFNGGDNYIRFKNMGLKVRWHPTQRVYHAWHPRPPRLLHSTEREQEEFIRHRAINWEYMAYDGIDPAKNRPYDPRAPMPGDWKRIVTERGEYQHPDLIAARRPAPPPSFKSRVKRKIKRVLGMG